MEIKDKLINDIYSLMMKLEKSRIHCKDKDMYWANAKCSVRIHSVMLLATGQLMGVGFFDQDANMYYFDEHEFTLDFLHWLSENVHKLVNKTK